MRQNIQTAMDNSADTISQRQTKAFVPRIQPDNFAMLNNSIKPISEKVKEALYDLIVPYDAARCKQYLKKVYPKSTYTNNPFSTWIETSDPDPTIWYQMSKSQGLNHS